MSLPDFSAPAGLTQLESYLASRSYIDGYTPSQADVAVFDALKSAPAGDKYPHVARWYSHISSYEKEHSDLKGDKSKAASLLSAAGSSSKAAPAAAAAAADDDDDDDVDLFGSDDEEEDAERERIKAERVAEYNAKKAAKGPRAASKSLVTLDIKVWDDETDLKETEKFVRAYEKDGLVWGLSKVVPIGYGISKIQMTLVVEDEKVSLDELQEYLQEEGEDYIQSTDVVAMAKL